MRRIKKRSLLVILAIVAACITLLLIVFLTTHNKKQIIAATITGAETNSSHVSRPIKYLWDGNVDDKFWSSDELEQSNTDVTVVLCLEKTSSVCSVELYPCIIEQKVCYFPKDFTISVSADGEEWRKVCEKTDYMVRGMDGQVFSFDTQADTRYVRLQMTSDSAYIRLSEAVVYTETGGK